MVEIALFCAGALVVILAGYGLAWLEDDHDDFSPL